MLLEPGGEALVQVGARRLRQRLVGGVADQEVAEAEAVLAGELRPVGPDQLLADERGQARRHLAPRRARAPAPRRGGRPRPRPRPARARSARPGRAGRGGPRAAPAASAGRRPRPSAVAGHRDHLLDEERVAAGGAGDLRAQLAGEPLGDQLVDVLVAERLEPERDRPRRAALGQLRPRHAEQQDRRAGGEQRDVLEQVEEGLLAPLDVVEDDDQRSLRRRVLRAACGTPRRSPRPRSAASRLAEQRADRRGGRLVRGQQRRAA